MNDFPFGYCTNVHAGVSLDEAKANLDRIATQVRQLVAPDARLPVGLWLAERAAMQLKLADETPRLRDWLDERSLKAYTFNGFPQGDFHQAVVKHAVYEPTWLEESRVEYTCALADILCGLLPGTQSGSISTLPLGWPHRPWQASEFQRTADNLRRVARHLRSLSETTGHEIVLAIEPEPGCVLDTAADLLTFFQEFLFDEAQPFIRQHITVCHDICHSAVMFETQAAALQSYADAGIRIGKVQVSCAIEVPWPESGNDAVLLVQTYDQLRTFNEPRYLHQTTRLAPQTGAVELLDDLPAALQNWIDNSNGSKRPPSWPSAPWRIHFHVPIYTQRFGMLNATSDDIPAAIAALDASRDLLVENRPWFTGDYEVETYAWSVLPPELQSSDLAHGIARELQHFSKVLQSP